MHFSLALVLACQWNLGPLHFIKKFIKDVYDREKKLSVRKTTRYDKIVTKYLGKSTTVETYQKRSEEKSHLPASFWIN